MALKEQFSFDTMATIKTPTDADVAAVRRVVRDVPMWKNQLASGDDVIVTCLPVLTANKILVADFRGKKVLVKFPMENVFSMVFDLHEQKIVNDMVSLYRGDLERNPKVLYVNDVCRVDEFVECRTLTSADYLDETTMKHLAIELATLHCDVRLKDRYIALKDGDVYTIADRLRGMHETVKVNFPIRRTRMATQVPEVHQALATTVHAAMEVLADTAFFMHVLNKCFPASSELVLSHNDLRSANVLYFSPTHVQIIDFDGANLCYRGADIGYMANNRDMQRVPWSQDDLDHFVQSYIDACAAKGVIVAKDDLMAQVERGKVLSVLFFMTMFGACDNWDIFHQIGFNFMATFPSLMQKIVAFAA
ncbi:hypothetical protein H310_13401 [Aphanomyces invadans]|uniref:Aminoglycoside phosphotransferase domain-containing protein n=1 Tax=Aphanomyces invadans TaxID=157072 RepID=A0A024TDL1_9STRA|nr:hypothetical protein H310_13401 [Aphanomyces invadans]ETV92148.1 hypothetical protein H310_13401 [Aphanomyces invadans]|eukprot:XP_008879112.1 hypothetical protein H310_13401 [Aphanomyces invadans]